MNPTLRFIALAAALHAVAPHTVAQSGALDPSFPPGAGVGGAETYVGVEAMVKQPDGRIIIGGSFGTYDGVARSGIARLNADGSLDATFDPGTGCTGGLFFGYVSALALQPDGKVIIGGDFTAVNGVPRNFIARLNSDGGVDASFDPGGGFNSAVLALALRADGKVVVGGDFTLFNGVSRNYIAQLDADGSLDLGFDPGTGFPAGTSEVYDLALQPDGKVLVGGAFTAYNGSPVQHLVRLQSTGALDASYPALANERVWCLLRQPDGRLLVGGQFTAMNGTARGGVARLLADGTLDAAFATGAGCTGGPVFALGLTAGGQVIATGRFLQCDGNASPGIALLLANGSADPAFDPGTGFNDPVGQGVTAVVAEADGHALVGGYFTSYDGVPRNALARVVIGCTAGTPCDDGDENTANDVLDANCVCMGTPLDPCLSNILEIEFQTDGISEVQWAVHDQVTDALVQSDGGPLTGSPIVGWSFCLPNGCYRLVVTDDGGDGIAGGGYVLRTVEPGVHRVIDNSFNFSTGYTSAIASNEGFCLPLGAGRLIQTSCDKLDWRTTPCGSEYMVATDNPAVTLQEGVSDATSGYQAWWYDPNGGYSFKRFQSFLTPNGLPPGPVRACHFLLNGWNGNQLQEGVLYNVKVRTRVNGVYDAWGPACRLMIDNAAAQCPRAKLMDIVGNTHLSCGQQRPISTTALVHARPVRRMQTNCTWKNANRYQFRFRIPAENVEIIKTSQSKQYWVNTNLLACGKTYEVDVRASFDNGATWCYSGDTWGEVCLLTTTCSSGMASDGHGGSAAEARLTLYPNPIHGEQLTVGISAVEDGVQTVAVDIYDAFGKRALARSLAVQDGYVNQVMELDGRMANGFYLVSITAGSQCWTERLVIAR